ncbi:hypothetical protein ONZ51_g3683 [Trametes cubensis]|uniref:Ubiquitin 3 binding protein But2 C-terminal domain-containing protein n=1 Tax=Trametes cubensis TaxID=1111947 RepID=A0AAD7TZN2_9APHY|nr:hypothetical protein ONZ51_g3683 [Trametes cubensis]
MPDETSYSLLASSSPHDSADHLQHFAEDDAVSSSRAQRSVGLSDMTCWRVLVFSCVAALILSTINLLSLSARATILMAQGYSTYMQPRLSQLRQPSVYLGLENVPVNPLSCRSRGTFPRRFYTYDANSLQPRLERVHGPDDKTTIAFGGSVRAVVDFYVPDYGLENCTLSLQRVSNGGFGMPDNTTGNIDVYIVHDAEVGIDPTATYLDTLSYISEQESTSRPFYCPSRSHVVFEWRCLTKDCVVYMPLEGVTSRTASGTSLSQTGFRVTQYEAMHCITD